MGYATESKAVSGQTKVWPSFRGPLPMMLAAAVAEAERACYALNANDALRRKMEPELRRLEVAAARGQLEWRWAHRGCAAR